ncbi:hypothetical protein AGMMS49983_03330 [Clostridia bacterium]|nr:hypothetical protein AGMMS49983_03330 [Clostridia bacterium]
MMQDDKYIVDDQADDTLDYEKDPRFIRYMKSRLEHALADRDAGLLIDSETVFSSIRDRYEW